MPIYKYYTAQGCLAQGFTVLAIALVRILTKTKILTNKSIPNNLGDFNNVNKEFLPKNSSQKIPLKEFSQKIPQKNSPQKNPPKKFQEKSPKKS